MAIKTSFNLIQEFNEELVNTNYNFINVQEADFPNLIKPMTDIGLSVQSAINYINTVIFNADIMSVNTEDTNVQLAAQNAVLQYSVGVTQEILHVSGVVVFVAVAP